MDREHPAWAAYRMRELDEPMRNALIEQTDNVIDIRAHCEQMRLDGAEMTMPFPFAVLDIEE